MLQNPSISLRSTRPLKDYSLAARQQQSPLRIRAGSRSPGHDRINSSYIPKNMSYHRLGPSLADKRYNLSSGNLDLPIGQSDEKQSRDEREHPANNPRLVQPKYRSTLD